MHMCIKVLIDHFIIDKVHTRSIEGKQEEGEWWALMGGGGGRGGR